MNKASRNTTSFTPVRKGNLADDVFTQLLSSILRGEFNLGDKLPPERMLAADFGVNRTSVREAIQKLSHLGLIETRQGDGSRILDRASNAGLDLLRYLFSSTSGPGTKVIKDIMEIRRIFLSDVARLASQRTEKNDLAVFRDILSRMESAGSDTRQLQMLEWEYFDRMSCSAKNEIFMLLINSFRPIFMENLDFFSSMILSSGDMLLAFKRITNAIENGDDDLASSLVEHYMRQGERIFLEIFVDET